MDSLVPFSIPFDGKPIRAPGIYSRVPLSKYHSGKLCDGPSISSSGLRRIFNESPAHYWCSSPLNPDCIPTEETEALVLGRAAHHLLLGEDNFSAEFIVRPDQIGGETWHGNKTVCRRWLQEQKQAGRTVLKPEQLEAIRGMARALSGNSLVNAGILNGAIEQTFAWRCKDTGFWKLARPDAVPNDSGDFVDLKTCRSVQTHALKTAIAECGYHQQGALILEGWHALAGSADSTFTLVFVEKTPPYCVRIVTLWHDDLVRGERQNFAAMDIFAKCLKENNWPGPGGADAEYLSLPEWSQKSIDSQLERATE